MSRLGRLPAVLLLAGALPGCTGMDEDTRETVENVVTLQTGVVSDLRERRGCGPFRTYDVPPGRMLLVVERAARKARDGTGAPVEAVWVSERYSEVVAKEPPADRSGKDDYSGPWRSAMVATVHPVPGDPNRSRVEVHATHRGPFHRGVVDWERDLPRWIDEVLAAEATGVLPIPD